MKHGYCIIWLILIGLLPVGCRSSRNSSGFSSERKTSERADSTTTRNYSESTKSDSIIVIASDTTREYSRIVDIDSAGRIRRIQEQWRNAGLVFIRSSTGRSSSFSVKDSSGHSTQTIQAQKQNKTEEQSKVDSRLIQGKEWFWIILGCAVIILYIPVYRFFKS